MEERTQGEFAIPPATHDIDLLYYWPSYVHASQARSRSWFLDSMGTPGFNNAAFIKAFSQDFLSVARFLNPGTKFDPTNITPRWNPWAQGHTEMLFNRTEAGAPVVQPVATASGLLERCRWVSVVLGGPLVVILSVACFALVSGIVLGRSPLSEPSTERSRCP